MWGRRTVWTTVGSGLSRRTDKEGKVKSKVLEVRRATFEGPPPALKRKRYVRYDGWREEVGVVGMGRARC